MSGALKAVGKVFKKAVKVVKKVALPALAIGAVVLTGGAALGILPAVGSMVGGLGLSAGVASALTTAITTAGVSGAIGFAASGGKMKGLVKGAVIGGVTGGVLGATGALTANAGGGGLLNLGVNQAATVSGAADVATGGIAPTSSIAGASSTPFALNPVTAGAGGELAGGGIAAGSGITGASATPLALNAISPQALTAGTTAAATAAPTAAASGGILNSLSNPLVLGPTIAGVGGGISSWAQANAEGKKARKEADRIAGNYGLLNSGADDESYAYSGAYRSPRVAFDPRQYGGKYEFDKASGKVVFVPYGG